MVSKWEENPIRNGIRGGFWRGGGLGFFRGKGNEGGGFRKVRIRVQMRDIREGGR